MLSSKYVTRNFSSFCKYQKIFPSAKRVLEDYGLDLNGFKNIPILTKSIVLDFISKNKIMIKNRLSELSTAAPVKNAENNTKQQTKFIVQEYMHKNVAVDNLFIDLNINPNVYMKDNQINEKLQKFIRKAGKVSSDKLKFNNISHK